MQSVRRSLRADGLPIVPMVNDRSGRTILVVRGRLAEIQPVVEHDDNAGNWHALATAACTLGHLHDALARCTAEPEQRDAPWCWPEAVRERLSRDAAQLCTIGERSGYDIRDAVSTAQRILDVLVDTDLCDCPAQLTHGDFQGPNILMYDGRVRAVIDFERLDRRPRLYDLAWPLVFWRLFGTTLGDWTEYDWRHAARCCRSYAVGTTRPPSEAEWQLLPLLMASIPAYGVADALGESDPVAEVKAFAVALPFAENLVTNPCAAVARLVP